MANYFNNLNEYSKKQNNQTFEKRQTLILSTKKNQGSAILRIVPDENGVPMRLIHDVWECYHNFAKVNEEGKPVLNDKGEQEWGYEFINVCGLQNYHEFELTPEQKILVEDTYKALEEYSQLVWDEEIDPEDEGLSVTRRSEVTIWWSKLIQYAGNSDLKFENDKPVLTRHHSAKFFQNFYEAQQAKSKMKGSTDWVEKYFSRTAGPCGNACSITTTLDRGYKVTIAFDEVAEFQLTEEFLKETTDLNKEIINVTKFNADPYIRIKDLINEVLDRYKSASAEEGGFTMYQEPPKAEIAKEAPVEVKAPVAGVAKPATKIPGAPKFGAPTSL